MKPIVNNQPELKKAVILLSGGLDSATCLAIAQAQGFTNHALSFAYGQRHHYELTAAQQVAQTMGTVEHRIFHLDIGQFGASALTDTKLTIPEHSDKGSIPITYVPARNTIFLAIALGYAETIGAQHLFIGANAVDYSGYPDCRPAFIEAFQHLANVATKASIEGKPLTVHAPLLHLSKADIIKQGLKLGVDYGLTVSCYQLSENGLACGRCHSCVLRRQGFEQAQHPDPTHYQ